MQKMTGQSMDIVNENIVKLKEIFPEVFSEDKIDFEKLQEELGSFIDKENERYNFTWNGKQEAKKIAQTPSTGTLRPCKEESKNFDTTQNLYIEGDNLEVLKLLQKSYHKKIKMIYIDPPYNTGKDFVYKDNFKDNIKNYLEITGQVDNEGNRLSTNSDTSGRYHSDWLNMIYPRLKLARNLLKDDGVIFISIDDNEVANLRKVCDEIFGEDNFVATFIWEKRTNRENRKVVSNRHDYVLCYAKSKYSSERILKQLPMNEKALSNYKNLDNDIRGDWKSDPATAQAGHGTKTQFYDLIAPNGKVHKLESGRCWLYTEKVMNEAILDNRIWFGKDGNGVPRIKTYLNAKERGLTPESIFFANEVTTTEIAKNKIKQLFNDKAVFDTPKPVDLIKILLQLCTEDNDIVLDFFGGSGTTAHSTISLNMDNKNRKFIIVQIPEETDPKSEAYKAGYKNICEIGKERIRRAGDKIVQESGKTDLDIGFKVFKLDSSNIKEWDSNFEALEENLLDSVDNIKSDRTSEDLLYEILLKYGLDLTLPIEEKTINSKKVFVIGFGALVVCLDNDIDIETVEEIAKLKSEYETEIMRVVFKDSSFKDAVVKTNAIQVLKQFDIDEIVSI